MCFCDSEPYFLVCSFFRWNLGFTFKIFLFFAFALMWLQILPPSLTWVIMQVLDLRSWTWSKIEAKSGAESLESPSPVTFAPCAGHSLVSKEQFYVFIMMWTSWRKFFSVIYKLLHIIYLFLLAYVVSCNIFCIGNEFF